MNTSETIKQQVRHTSESAAQQIEDAMHEGASKVRAMRERIDPALDTARHRLNEIGTQIRGRTLDAAKTTDGYVRTYPWYFLGAAVALGLILGAYASRSRP